MSISMKTIINDYLEEKKIAKEIKNQYKMEINIALSIIEEEKKELIKNMEHAIQDLNIKFRTRCMEKIIAINEKYNAEYVKAMTILNNKRTETCSKIISSIIESLFEIIK